MDHLPALHARRGHRAASGGQAGSAAVSSPGVSSPARADGSRGVESLVHWIPSVECFELPMSSLTDAVDLVKRLGRVTMP
jgi:hypothetical protein